MFLVGFRGGGGERKDTGVTETKAGVAIMCEGKPWFAQSTPRSTSQIALREHPAVNLAKMRPRRHKHPNLHSPRTPAVQAPNRHTPRIAPGSPRVTSPSISIPNSTCPRALPPISQNLPSISSIYARAPCPHSCNTIAIPSNSTPTKQHLRQHPTHAPLAPRRAFSMLVRPDIRSP